MSTTPVTHVAPVAHVVTDSGSTTAIALESGGNLAAIRTAVETTAAAASPYVEPAFEVSRTGLWRTKAASCVNVIGRRGGSGTKFVNNVLNDLVGFSPTVAVIPELAGTEALEIISTNTADAAAGTGARTVRVTYIDALNTVGAQVSATFTMNGTTAVSLGAVRALAIQWAAVATVGSGGVAAGDITIRATATPTNIYEQITAGGNRSMSGRYMVPVGMSAYCDNWTGSAVVQDMDLRLRATVAMEDRSLTTTYLFQDATYPPQGTVSPGRDLPWLKFPALSKIKISALPGAITGGPRCEGAFSLVVITN